MTMEDAVSSETLNISNSEAFEQPAVLRTLTDRIAQAALAVQVRARAMGRFVGATELDEISKVSPRETEYAAAALEAVQAHIDQTRLRAYLEGRRCVDEPVRAGHPSAFDLVVELRAENKGYVLILEAKRASAPRGKVLTDLDRLAHHETAQYRWFLVVGTAFEAQRLFEREVGYLLSMEPGDAAGEWSEEGVSFKVTRRSLRFHCGPAYIKNKNPQGVDFAAVYSVDPL